MKNSKRILSVTINRMGDYDADTSYLGGYSDRPKSEYAVNRGHDTECASQTFNPKTIEAKRMLEHVQQTIGDLHNAILAQYNGTLANAKLDAEKDALDEAYEQIGELIDTVSECDCWQKGARDTRSYEWFNPCIENYEGIDTAETLKYCLQDYERMEDLQKGNWYFLGIRAEAKIGVQIGSSKYSREFDPSLRQTITSGGLWGIESDCDDSYLTEVEQEQLAELRAQLKAIGFSARAISTALKNIERKEA